jgi:CRISPR-associated protein Cas5d
MSYPVPTPSASRGILEAIYWKPEITWVVDSIRVLNPIQYMGLRRNEVSRKANFSEAYAAHKAGRPLPSLIVEECRQQRHALVLRDVRYVIGAHFVVNPSHLPGHDEAENTPMKHIEMFTRRAQRGQHFTQPYFGCREFIAHYRLPQYPLSDRLPENQRDQDFGYMLHDLIFTQDPVTKVTSSAVSRVFYASMRDGLITIPPLA